jgi:hypothetical protein
VQADPYAYGTDDPINNVDPTGNFAASPASTLTPHIITGGIDFCVATAFQLTAYAKEDIGWGEAECTGETELEAMSIRLWDRNSSGVYHLINALACPAEWIPPNDEFFGLIIAGICKTGDRIHAEFVGAFAYDGNSADFDANTSGGTCR